MYKFIDRYNIKKFNDRFIKISDVVYTNPTVDTLMEAGYKPVRAEDEPIYNSGTQYLTIYYQDSQDYIIQKYEVNDIKNEEV